jgi:hypothetical protein
VRCAAVVGHHVAAQLALVAGLQVAELATQLHAALGHQGRLQVASRLGAMFQ